MEFTKDIYRKAVNHALTMIEHSRTEDEILYSLEEELSELTDKNGDYLPEEQIKDYASQTFYKALRKRYVKGLI